MMKSESHSSVASTLLCDLFYILLHNTHLHEQIRVGKLNNCPPTPYIRYPVARQFIHTVIVFMEFKMLVVVQGNSRELNYYYVSTQQLKTRSHAQLTPSLDE